MSSSSTSFPSLFSLLFPIRPFPCYHSISLFRVSQCSCSCLPASCSDLSASLAVPLSVVLPLTREIYPLTFQRLAAADIAGCGVHSRLCCYRRPLFSKPGVHKYMSLHIHTINANQVPSCHVPVILNVSILASKGSLARLSLGLECGPSLRSSTGWMMTCTMFTSIDRTVVCGTWMHERVCCYCDRACLEHDEYWCCTACLCP